MENLLRKRQGRFQIGACFKERILDVRYKGFKMDYLIKYEWVKVGLDKNGSTLFNRENGWDLGKDKGYPQLFLNCILFYPKATVDKQFLTVVAIPMDTLRFKKGYPQGNERPLSVAKWLSIQLCSLASFRSHRLRLCDVAGRRPIPSDDEPGC